MTPRAFARFFAMRAAVIAAAAMTLAACASSSPNPLSSLPKELGGLPENTPARPATPAAYPAVHDIPPPRTKAVLTEEEIKQTEAELTAARDRAGKPAGAAARAR
jgi:hypothetical protein